MDDDTPPEPPEGITYYELLGVDTDANTPEVEQAYQNLIETYHPETCDLENAEEICKRIEDARDVLTDPRKRQRYEQEGHEMYTGEPLLEHSKFVNSDGDGSDESGVGEDVEVGGFDGAETFDTEPDDPFAEAKNEGSVDDDEIENVGKSAEEMVEERMGGQEDIPTDTRRPQEPVSTPNPVEEPERATPPDSVPKTPSTNTSAAGSVDSGDTPPVHIRLWGEIAGVFDYLEKFTSNDVVSTAVRRAWTTRISVTVLIVSALLVLGTFAANNLYVFVLPQAKIIETEPVRFANLMMVVLTAVFLGDQIKTEADVDRGQINSAIKPAKWGVIGMVVLAIGAGIGLYTWFENGVNVFEMVTAMRYGDSVQTDTMTEMVLNVGSLSFCFLGLLIAVPTISRYVWYARYVRSVRVLPGVWDYFMASPLVLFVVMLFTGLVEFSIPVLADVVSSAGFADLFGINSGAFALSGVAWLGVLTPLVVGCIVFVRVTVEWKLVRES